MAAVVAGETVEEFEELERPSQISWGAVFAGLVFVASISWLMFTLGTAIGVGIADATDSEAIGEGLGIGALIWMLATSLIAYFLGAMLTARLSGKFDKATGMLHGVTLWSVGTALMLLAGYMGVTGLIQTGQQAVSGVASAVSSAASGMGSGVSSAVSGVGNAAENLADSPMMTRAQAMLKRQAATVISEAGGAEISQADAREAVNEIDPQTLQTVTTELLTGNVDGAREALANGTDLSEDDINSLIRSTERALGEIAGNSATNNGQDPALFENVQQTLAQQAAQMVSAADGSGGVDVSAEEVRNIASQLDAEALQSVAMALVNGNPDAAKDALVVNTDLTDEQINAVVDGVATDIEQQVEAAQTQINEAAETASDYAQAVLWAAFISSALGLAVSIFGGGLGASFGETLLIASRRRSTVIS